MDNQKALYQNGKTNGLSPKQQKVIIFLSLAASLIITTVCLSLGITNIFPYIFIVPIILTAYWYPQKGIIFAAGTCAVYLIEVALFSTGSLNLLFSALIQAVIFFDIGVVISLMRREGEEYRALATRAIKELNKERERYEAVVETQTEFICRFLPDGRNTFANKAYCKYFGKTQEELRGKVFKPNIHPEDRRKLQKFLADITPENPIGSIEHRIIMQDNTIHWQQWVDQGIFDDNGDLKEYQSVGRDITKHKEAETALQKSDEKLRESEKRMRILLSNLVGMAYVCSVEKGYPMTFVSQGARDLTGYEPEDLISHQIRYDDLVHPDDREEIFSKIHLALNEHRPFNIQYRITTKEKKERWVFEQGRGTYDKEGTLQTIEGYITDITQKVQTEIELKRSLEEKTVLLQEVHHRVRNNLAIIVGLIGMQMQEVDDPTTQEYLQYTENRIMALANVHEAIYRSKDVAAINMTEHIENMGSYILTSGSCNLECTLQVHQTDCQVSLQTAIPVSLILNEMLTNSLKHAFVGRDSGNITVSYECTGENYILTYSDDGIGIDDSFDITSTKSLGINLIQRLAITQLKGTIEYSNKNGTTWVIRFPKLDE